MRLQYILLLFLLACCQLSSAQILTTTDPQAEGFSVERLRKIDTLIQSYIDSNKVGNADAIIVREGKIVYYKAFGYRDFVHKTPLQKDDLFRIASQSKAITVTGLMTLFEEGKFMLDDPLSEYIPEFKNATVLKTFNAKDSSYTTEPANREVTVRDIITHTSGISYAVIGSKEANAIYAKAGIPVGFEPRNITLADEMKKLAKLPLMHQPGAAWTYGLNIDMVGYLIEVLSHQSLKDFLQQRIFTPLGMKDTYFYVPAAKQNRLAQVFKTENGHVIQNTANDSAGINVNYPLSTNASYYSGGAGLTSTAYDYALFLQMILNGGSLNGKQILSPNTVRLISTNQIGDLSLWGGDKMGLGFEITQPESAARLPWHVGSLSWGGFWGSHYWIDPTSKLVVQIWSQGGLSDLQDKFKVMVYSAMVQ